MQIETQRFYERLERLAERMAALIDEHARRLEVLEGLPTTLAQINQSLGRLEAKIESQKQVSSIVQAIVWLLLGGVAAAGFELFKH